LARAALPASCARHSASAESLRVHGRLEQQYVRRELRVDELAPGALRRRGRRGAQQGDNNVRCPIAMSSPAARSMTLVGRDAVPISRKRYHTLRT
jgi:hypothetical protein